MADDNSVYRDIFFEESEDNLTQLNDNILELEKEPDNIDLINEIFRAAHTLKGMSATMGYTVMSKLTHKMEDIFDLFKSGKLKVTSDHISLIFRCLDKLTELLDGLRDEEEQSEDQITELWNELDKVENIAGIVNKEGNVLGMMPHPERAMEELLGGADGRKMFASLLKNFLVTVKN